MKLSTWEADELADEIGRQREYRDGFRRSKKGNLWQRFEGLVVVIFQRKWDGLYGCCISDDDGPTFEGAWGSEVEAIAAVYEVLPKPRRRWL
jgi:hypothetical protein